MRTKLTISKVTEPRLVAALVSSVGFLRLLILWLKPDGRLVTHIPDDAFYYLVPARNFALHGRWSFDGVEPATGFHLLWGYCLALLFKVNPSLSFHAIFAIAGSIQVASLAVAAFLLTRTAVRLFGRGAGWGIAAVFLSASILVQGGWLMESAFVIAVTACIVDRLSRLNLDGSIPVLAGYALLGWLLELARSDSGLLASFLLLMHLVLWRRKAVDRSMPLAASFVLVGAVVGVITILLHTHAVSGGWVQASARQKLFWSSIAGRGSLRAVAGTPLSVLQPLHNAVPHYSRSKHLLYVSSVAGHLIGYLVTLLVLGGAFFAWRRSSQLARGMLLTLGLLVLAYCVFYQYDGALFDWYVSNFAVALALAAAAAAAWYMPRTPRLTSAMVVFLAIAGFTCSLVPNGPWQESMYRAGIYLRDHPLPGAQGAFNSGIVGFFAEHPVVNLDGLVNDRILPYSVQGRLAEYMANRNVTYIFDSPYMLHNPLMQRRGGYADGKLLGCLRDSKDTFADDPNNNWEGSRIHLYRFDAGCLKSTAGPATVALLR